MKKLAVVFILILVVLPVFSYDFSAEYIDGYLDVKDSGEWLEVYIGDVLPSNAVVKLDRDSYAEISSGSNMIKLSRPGIYKLSELVHSRAQVADSGTSSVFSGKFRTLLREQPEKSQSTVAGVRAAEAETVSVDWLSSDVTELIADGRDALSAGKLEDALDLFSEAYDFSADSYEENEALYYIGLASAVKGNYSDALDNLDLVDAAEDSQYYTDFYLLKGQLLVESFAYKEAFVFLNRYKTSAGRNNPEKLQEYYFLLAVSGNNAGEKTAALAALDKVIRIDPDSSAAVSAEAYKDNI